MTQSISRSAELSRAASDAKCSINLRIEARTRAEFMVDSARARVIDVLRDQRLFVLGPEAYDAFADALDNPPPPGPKLRALMRRTPAWKV